MPPAFKSDERKPRLSIEQEKSLLGRFGFTKIERSKRNTRSSRTELDYTGHHNGVKCRIEVKSIDDTDKRQKVYPITLTRTQFDILASHPENSAFIMFYTASVAFLLKKVKSISLTK